MTAHTQEASTTDTETARNAVPPPMAGRRRSMRLPLWFIILFALIVDGGFGPNHAAEGVTDLHSPEYKENGAGTANLVVDSYNAWSLTQTIAVKAANQFRLGRVTIAAEASAGWEHDYLAAPAARQAFAVCPECPWMVEYPESRDRAVVGASLTAIVSRRLEVAFRYEGKLAPGRVDTDVNLGAMLKF